MTGAAHGRLVLVPTPLDFGVARPDGVADLREVLPLGAIRSSARLAHWVAENAKTLRAFLKRVDAIEPLAQPLQSLQIVELPRAQKGATRVDPPLAALQALLAPALEGHDIGLACEAGMPAIADPGAALVAAAHAAQIEVVPLPGPNSLLLALAASGLNGQRFAFVGYLPVETSARAARIRELEALSRRAAQSQLMIETPYRNAALLGALVSNLGATTRLSVSCGLTLAGGWTRSTTVAQWRAEPKPIAADIPAVFALLAG
jgi:16S rRNA (cytidine1402-2'-O)-methyltransferase